MDRHWSLAQAGNRADARHKCRVQQQRGRRRSKGGRRRRVPGLGRVTGEQFRLRRSQGQQPENLTWLLESGPAVELVQLQVDS